METGADGPRARSWAREGNDGPDLVSRAVNSCPAADGVSTADLTEWTGSDQVLGEVDDTDEERASCSTDYDDTGLIVEWSVRPTIGSFQVEGENAQLNGLERTRVDLAVGLPAWQLTGEVSGSRLASVVTVFDGDRTLVVEAGDDGDADATFTDEQMDEVVLRVADAVVEAQTA